MFVAGSAIFNTDDYAETIRTMRSELAKVRQHHRSNDPCDSSRPTYDGPTVFLPWPQVPVPGKDTFTMA